MNSKFYIDDNPLIVLPLLVKELGGHVVKAVLLQQIHFMLKQPRSGIDHDGHHWIWKTADEWVEDYFIWLSPGTVSNYLNSLEKDGWIISTSRVTSQWDATKYYRIGNREVNSSSSTDELLISSTDELSVHPQMNSYTKTTSKTTADKPKHEPILTNPWDDEDEDAELRDKVFRLINDNYVTAFDDLRGDSKGTELDNMLSPYIAMAERYGFETLVRAFMAAKADKYRDALKPKSVEHFINADGGIDATANKTAAPTGVAVAMENTY